MLIIHSLTYEYTIPVISFAGQGVFYHLYFNKKEGAATMNKTNENENSDIKAYPFKETKIEVLSIDQLIPYEDHPFQLYTGQRKTDMVESVRANGIHTPILVRPKDDGTYEILSGHNRVEAAKEAGYITVPVIIRKGLSDEAALLTVTETNLIQRSFTDLSHSERAIALATHYEAIKKNPGYRTDLIEEIEKLTNAPVGRRSGAREKVGSTHGIGKTTVSRYLHINKLIPTFKERLDNGKIALRTAESLSFLKDADQEAVASVLGDASISWSQAEKLRDEASDKKLTKAIVTRILKPEPSESQIKPLQLKSEFLSQFFSPDQTQEDIEKVLAEALELYMSKQDNE